MQTRRQFLGSMAVPAACGAAALTPSCISRVEQTFEGRKADDPDRVAADESVWFEVQRAFAVDRSQINLNNGGVSPAPSVAIDAFKRHVDFSNELPSRNLWQVLGPQREPVRAGLARLFGCDAEEIAITRNASESLQICQLGIDLERGDEVLTTDQDYPRMLATFRQRAAREGVELKTIKVPVPCEDPAEVVRRFEAAITGRTRVILMCHVVNLTGQILPVREVVQMARARGVPVIVDGAHSFAHFEFTRDDLDCDYFGTSLHKWLFAPHGTGMLYVRRDKIGDLWPMMGADETLRDDVRKFEQIGTHPIAQILAIGEALLFHHGISPAHKEARLRHLRNLWAERLLENDRTVLNTSLDPRFSCGIANVRFEGIETKELVHHLWQDHRILTVGIHHEDFQGIRVSPSVYTSLEELDRFCSVIEGALEKGLPA